MGIKYNTNGWTISDDGIEALKKVIIPGMNVIEFGSGISTQFFLDFGCIVDSFDNDKTHAHPYANVVDLVECDDASFDKMFTDKMFDPALFIKMIHPVHTRQHNVFYNISPTKLKPTYDLLFLDGPHGNGRSIAFLHCVNRLPSGSYIFIDDYNHYDFLERCRSIFNVEIIEIRNVPNDRYVLVKVI